MPGPKKKETEDSDVAALANAISEGVSWIEVKTDLYRDLSYLGKPWKTYLSMIQSAENNHSNSMGADPPLSLGPDCAGASHTPEQASWR